jgi:hypothetical protein
MTFYIVIFSLILCQEIVFYDLLMTRYGSFIVNGTVTAVQNRVNSNIGFL